MEWFRNIKNSIIKNNKIKQQYNNNLENSTAKKKSVKRISIWSNIHYELWIRKWNRQTCRFSNIRRWPNIRNFSTLRGINLINCFRLGKRRINSIKNYRNWNKRGIKITRKNWEKNKSWILNRHTLEQIIKKTSLLKNVI